MATIDSTGKLIIHRGESVILPFTYKQDGAGVNLTGKNVTFRMTKSDGARAHLTLTTGQDPNAYGAKLVFISAAAGTFRLTLTDEQTERFAKDTAGIWSFTYDDNGEDILIYRGKYSVKNL
jgi:hypothetical protein